jgi:hypothetical protein
MNGPDAINDTLGLAGDVATGGFAGAVLVWARAGRAMPVATRAVAINRLDIFNLLGEATLGSVIKITASPQTGSRGWSGIQRPSGDGHVALRSRMADRYRLPRAMSG